MWQYLIDFFKSFNNNEIALIILLIVSILSFKTLRNCVYSFIKYLLQSKFFRLIFLELGLYFLVITFILYKFGYWKISFLKDSILWFLLSGFVLYKDVMVEKNWKLTMKSYLVKVFSFSALYEFVANIFCLPIWLLFALIPLYFILGGIEAYSENNKEYEPVNKFASWLLSFCGFAVFIFVIYKLKINYKLVFTKEQLHLFILPTIYTVAFLPFSFINKVFEEYRLVFKRLSLRKDIIIPVDFKYVFKIYKFCKFDFIKLNKFLFFLTSSEYLKQTTNIEELIQEYKRRTTFIPFNSSIIGFSIDKMVNLFKEYDLIISDYKYLEYDDGYGNYYGNAIAEINKKSFNTVTYSISGTNQAVQHLQISYFKSSLTNEELSAESDNLYKKLCSILYTACINGKKLKKNLLNKSFEDILGNYKIKNQIEYNSEKIIEYKFSIFIINPVHSKYYIS